jgi:hypothetical protein
MEEGETEAVDGDAAPPRPQVQLPVARHEPLPNIKPYILLCDLQIGLFCVL